MIAIVTWGLKIKDIPPPSPEEKERIKMCEHKWVFQQSIYHFEYGHNAAGQDHYQRIDTYYCNKCLETKEITAKDEWSRERPYWWKKQVGSFSKFDLLRVERSPGFI